MKNKIFKLSLGFLPLIFAIIFIGTNCNGSGFDPINNNTSCDANSSNLKVVYNGLQTVIKLNDYLVHQYTFVLNSTATLCKIGYTGDQYLVSKNVPYTIEIEDTSSNTIVYTGQKVFDYQQEDFLATDKTLKAGKYIIRRILDKNYIANSTGLVIKYISKPTSAQLTNGNIQIMSSYVYNSPAIEGETDTYLPKINLVFQ